MWKHQAKEFQACKRDRAASDRRQFVRRCVGPKLARVLRNGREWRRANGRRIFALRSRKKLHWESVNTNVSYTSSTRARASQPDRTVAKREEALSPLYLEYFLACMTERTWRFAVPLVLSTKPNSMSVVAVTGFVGQLACFAAGPFIGSLLDGLPRYQGLVSFTILQALAISLQSIFLWGFISGPYGNEGYLPSLFLGLCLMQVLDRLAALATDVAIERDWIVRLVGRKRPIALAKANATLRRIDLLSELLGPFLFGMAIANFNCRVVLPLVSLIVISAVPAKIVLLNKVLSLGMDLLQKRPLLKAAATVPKFGLSEPLEAIGNAWKVYLKQPISATSISLIFLFFNAVLTPGGIMTVLLTEQGISSAGVTVFRTLCATIGLASTLFLARIIGKNGLIRAGLISLMVINVCILSAAAIYALYLSQGLTQEAVVLGINGPLIMFCAAIAMSRFGLWAYDMIESQMFQMTVPSEEASAVSSVEIALCSLGELFMLGMVASFADHFGKLVFISGSFVFIALIVYVIWMYAGAERTLPQISKTGRLSEGF